MGADSTVEAPRVDWRDRRVAVVGCGGLGVPAAWALVLAGARKLRLIDDDVVAADNLHRQVLFREADIGRPKVDALSDALRAIALASPDLEIDTRQSKVTARDSEWLLNGCDVAIECSDDAVCKFAINDWAVSDRGGANRRVASIAAAIGRRGQWMVVAPGGACYRCIFEEPPPPEMLATCAIAGVLGPVVGQVGALAARSAVAVLSGMQDPAFSALVRRLPDGLRQTPVAQAANCRCAKGWRACG